MPFILIIIGLFLIFIGLKIDRKTPDINRSTDFNSVIDYKALESEMDNVNKEIFDINSRINNMEESILLINDKIETNKVEDKNSIIDEKEEVISEIIVEENDKDVLENKVPQDLNEIILDLSNQGKNIDEIASFLKIGKGEILLRLGLKNQRK